MRGRERERERESKWGARGGSRTVRNIYVYEEGRAKQRRRARYRLFPGALVSDLAGDVSVGIQEESGQTTTTTTRGLVSNLRRIYPASPTPSSGAFDLRGRVHTVPARRQSVSPDSRWEIAGTAAIYYRCLQPRTRTFYCERLGGIRLIPRNTCDFIIHKYLR